jgi:hypothetical protein
MLRRGLLVASSALLLSAAVPGVALAGATPHLIQDEEVGYFGSATVTHTVAVFVYSNLGPAAGNRVTVCVAGRCERAHGHNARLAWYSATFRTRHGFHMGDPVTFAIHASDGSSQDSVKVSRELLCMHNDGSTPQH